MSDLLADPVVPVADETDARATAHALSPYVAETATVTVVYVVEKAGGAADKASVEQRELHAEDAFDAFRDVLADTVDVTTTIRYHTDVVESVFETAAAHDATAVAFVPRGGGTLLGLLTGNRTKRLVTENDLPVVSLPAPDGGDG